MNLTIDESRLDEAATHLAERLQLTTPELTEEQATVVAERALRSYAQDLVNERLYDVARDVMVLGEMRILRRFLDAEIEEQRKSRHNGRVVTA